MSRELGTKHGSGHEIAAQSTDWPELCSPLRRSPPGAVRTTRVFTIVSGPLFQPEILRRVTGSVRWHVQPEHWPIAIGHFRTPGPSSWPTRFPRVRGRHEGPEQWYECASARPGHSDACIMGLRFGNRRLGTAHSLPRVVRAIPLSGLHWGVRPCTTASLKGTAASDVLGLFHRGKDHSGRFETTMSTGRASSGSPRSANG
jgi:hypothetical protein